MVPRVSEFWVTILLPVALPGWAPRRPHLYRCVGRVRANRYWRAGDSAMITAGIYGLFGQDTATHFNRLLLRR